MSDILVVTNLALCREDFLRRIERIAAARPAGIILREKDLPGEEYRNLAEAAIGICRENGVACLLHSFADLAKELGCTVIHMPLCLLRGLSAEERGYFTVLGASCHSVDDAVEAEGLGCTYITAGHVFDTDCKKGSPGRGLGFLREICGSVRIPVYAIGGIAPGNIGAVRNAGAAGGCVMSGAMVCSDVRRYFSEFEENQNEV